MLTHLFSRHKNQHLVLINRNGELHLQPLSTLERHVDELPQDGPHAVEGNDGLDDTPSGEIEPVNSTFQESHEAPLSYEISGIDFPNSLDDLDALPLLARNDELDVNIDPHSMLAAFDMDGMEIDEEGNVEMSESDVDVEASFEENAHEDENEMRMERRMSLPWT